MEIEFEININPKEVDFKYATFNLQKDTYQPFRKPKDNPLLLTHFLQLSIYDKSSTNYRIHQLQTNLQLSTKFSTKSKMIKKSRAVFRQNTKWNKNSAET